MGGRSSGVPPAGGPVGRPRDGYRCHRHSEMGCGASPRGPYRNRVFGGPVRAVPGRGAATARCYGQHIDAPRGGGQPVLPARDQKASAAASFRAAACRSRDEPGRYQPVEPARDSASTRRADVGAHTVGREPAMADNPVKLAQSPPRGCGRAPQAGEAAAGAQTRPRLTARPGRPPAASTLNVATPPLSSGPGVGNTRIWRRCSRTRIASRPTGAQNRH